VDREERYTWLRQLLKLAHTLGLMGLALGHTSGLARGQTSPGSPTTHAQCNRPSPACSCRAILSRCPGPFVVDGVVPPQQSHRAHLDARREIGGSGGGRCSQPLPPRSGYWRVWPISRDSACATSSRNEMMKPPPASERRPSSRPLRRGRTQRIPPDRSRLR